MTKTTIEDSSSIKVMAAGIKAIEDDLRLRRAERDVLRVKNTEAILAAAGVVFGVTKVRVWEGWLGREIAKPGPFFAMSVRPQGQIEFAKVKADGKPSAAPSGLSNVISFEVIE